MATHVRFLQAELLARLEELLGRPGRVTALDLRVGPKKLGLERRGNSPADGRDVAPGLVDSHRCDFGL